MARAETAGVALTFCLVRVGELRLLFEPSEVIAIDGVHSPSSQELPEVDLRLGLELPPLGARAEAFRVRTPQGPLRLVVCRIEQILRHQLREVHPLPHVLRRFGRRLGLRGVVELSEGAAYLVSAAELGAALRGRSAA